MRRKYPRGPKTEKGKQSNTLIMVAIIGAAATIIAAFLNSPLIENWLGSSPTPTLTPTVTFIVATSTPLVSPSPAPSQTSTLTNSPTSTATFTPTKVITASASPSPKSRTDKMYANLEANLFEGKSPLRVNLDARSSYVQFATGNVVECGNSQFCSFTFSIFRDYQFVENFQNNDGRLSYLFSKKGEYTVAVYVCRGGACSDTSVMIYIR